MMKKLLCTVILFASFLMQAQDITITGNGTTIVDDGSNVPTTLDDTDFGSQDVSAGAIRHTFTITNNTLNLIVFSDNGLTGPNTSDFSRVIGDVLPGFQSRTFTVDFDPNGPAGLKQATVNITTTKFVGLGTVTANYAINVQGTATIAPAAPEINVSGLGVPIANFDFAPSPTDDTDFGNVPVGNTETHTFTITNTGTDPLNLTGTPMVDVVGGVGTFSVTNLPTSPIPIGGSTTFDITFSPPVTPTSEFYSATVLIQSDDSSDLVFAYGIQGNGIANAPDIEVSGLGTPIANFDNTPSATDDTEFGNVPTGSSLTHTFTITNNGTADLDLTGTPLVDVLGGAGNFTITNLPTTPIAPAASTTFDVTFTPLAAGYNSAQISIQSNDAVDGNFIFSIQGTGVLPAPEMDIFGNGTEITSGDTTPDVADDTDYGQVDVTSGNVSTTFTIENNGTGDLTLTDASPYITISGANSADFSISGVPTGTVTPSSSTTFAITFNPSAVGVRTATISIANDDADENPYTFDVQGEGIDANAGSPLLITQYYEGLGANDNWIEVKNISTSTTLPGAWYLNLYTDLNGTVNGGIATNVPDQSVVIPALSPGEVVLFQRAGATLPSAGNRGAVSTTTTEVCSFTGNDIILISTTNDATAYDSRIDIIGTVGVNATVNWGSDTSLIKGCGTTEAANTTYSASEYITLTLDEVNNASTLSNVALGIQTVGPTIWTSSWDNGLPDKTKATIINGTYANSNGSFEACDLTVNGGASINLNGGTTNYIQVDNDLTINGTFTIGDTESLVMINPSANISGQISKIETTTSLNNFRDFTYWSSPVNTTIGAAFTGVDSNRIYRWDTASSAWFIASGSMTQGRGYIAEAPSGTPDGGTHTVTFNGTPNNGLVGVPVIFNNDGLEYTDYNLIGNPYPSAIDIDQFISLSDNSEIRDNDDLDGTIYLWTHSTQISDGTTGDFIKSDYATYNLAGGTASVNGGPVPTNNIGSGQGFFARARSNGTVFFQNDMRLTNQNNQFFKSITKKATEEKDRIWLDMTSESGAFNQLLVGFFDKATDAEDRGYDGLKFGGANLKFYSKIGDSKYAIQGLGAFDQSKQVTLGFDTTIARTFKIAIANIEGVLKDEDVYLVDNLLNVVHDLKQVPYEFEVTEAGNYSDRFTLQFNKTTLGVDDLELNNSFVVINEENAFRLKSNSIITNIKIYDITGRLLINKSPNENEFTVKTRNISKGTVLILNATMEGGAEVSKKAIKY